MAAFRITVLSFFLFSVLFVSAQSKKQPIAPPAAPTAVDSHLFNGLEWRSIGPYRGGRSLTASGVIGDPLTYYMGATGGGVWKSTDGGNYWFSVSDSTFTSASVGALAVSASDPNVIYVGMGEAAIRNSAIMGDGIYKSDNAGKTWKHVFPLDASATGRIIVHPKNPDIAYAAVMGKMFGTNKERGLYETTDGGKTWKNILFQNDSTGCIDVDFDPSNPNILYASFWQVNRKPWKLQSGGSGCELFKSMDGGKSWKSLSKNPGMPKGVLGKMCMAVSASDPNRIYALIESKSPGLFRSEDGGATWNQVSTSNDITQRPWYFSEVFCDPLNKDIVYISNLELMKSIDGGRSFHTMSQEHGDNHDVWINPNNSDNFIIADDGSVAVTFNGGRTWTAEDLPTAQMYHVNLDDDFPYNAYGGQQDWGSVRIATRTYGSSIGSSDWYGVAGGEAGYIVPHPGEPDVTYGGEYDGILTRYDKRNEQTAFVSVDPYINDGWGANTWKYRFAWTYPIGFSPWNKDVLYCTSNHVHRSLNGGMSWETISPDLTRNDPAKQLQSGGILTPDNTGAEIYCTVYAFAESPVQQGLLWAGSDDGLVHISKDNGKTWEKVTPAGLPEWSTVAILEPSPFDAGTCYLAAYRYRLDDVHPYLFKTTDFGRTWTKITTGIPSNDYARCVREDPNQKNLLYAGTETGVYVSFNGGSSWQSLRLNMPTTPVWDMQIKKESSDLVIATYGRGFWVLDNCSVLKQAISAVGTAETFLYKPLPALRMDGGQTSVESAAASHLEEGTNAPNGVIIDYFLKKDQTDEVKITFHNAQGGTVITFSSLFGSDGKPFKKEEAGSFYDPLKPSSGEQLKANAGMHRFVWDMRYPAALSPAEDYWSASSLKGARVVPGDYTVKLWIGEKLVGTEPVHIDLNPEVHTSRQDLQAQFDLATQINRKQDEIARRILQCHGVRKQVEDFLGSFSDTTAAGELKKIARPLLDSLQAIEDTLINSKIKTYLDPLRYPYQLYERYLSLNDFVNAGDARPSQQMVQVFDELNGKVADVFKRLDHVLETQVSEFNKAVESKNLKLVDPARALPTIKMQ